METHGTVAALLYHHVGPVCPPACRGLTIEPATFARHMSTLSAMGYTAILPDDWAAHVRGEKDVPPRSVMITFDDAYADLCQYAFPVLEKHGFPTIVFVPTSLVGTRIKCGPRDSEAELPLMTHEQLLQWAARGVTFGAHSRTHADLTALDRFAAANEIIGSRDDLARLIGTPVTSFAYPYGKYNGELESVVAQSFSTAFAIEEGLNDSSIPLSALRRTMVQNNDSLVDVLLRARYGKSVLQRLRTAVRS
jgi:peptidoglycan/xylan/chitin deacetylase (PgdA/CDA1 family)